MITTNTDIFQYYLGVIISSNWNILILFEFDHVLGNSSFTYFFIQHWILK